jgi:hypothetical protein
LFIEELLKSMIIKKTSFHKQAVFARLPRGGLGNKLLVWACALIFAKINNLPLYVSGWAEIKIGPYIRLERTKRKYWRYVKDEFEIKIYQKLLFLFLYKIQSQSKIENLNYIYNENKNKNILYLFHVVPSWTDYFEGIRNYNEFIREAFNNILIDKYQKEFKKNNFPVIGVHIRRSDFRELKENERLGDNCNVRIPINYFVEVISKIREIAGKNLHVTIFTDGYEQDVKEVLALPQVSMSLNNSDILDLINLSRSLCLVTSLGSTFSYWAAYIGNGLIINHPADTTKIRMSIDKESQNEFQFDPKATLDPLLISRIKNISRLNVN